MKVTFRIGGKNPTFAQAELTYDTNAYPNFEILGWKGSIEELKLMEKDLNVVRKQIELFRKVRYVRWKSTEKTEIYGQFYHVVKARKGADLHSDMTFHYFYDESVVRAFWDRGVVNYKIKAYTLHQAAEVVEEVVGRAVLKSRIDKFPVFHGWDTESWKTRGSEISKEVGIL